MYILDTDHLTFLELGAGREASRLIERLSAVDPADVATTIITYEEQTRGWMAFLSTCRTLTAQVEAYRRLERHLECYRHIPVLGFDQNAAVYYQQIRARKPKIGAMDMKIAAIVVSRSATLLSRNARDFSRIQGLRIEDWTK
jgi:tRNA(fMet)-specific endonuclease VapC